MAYAMPDLQLLSQSQTTATAPLTDIHFTFCRLYEAQLA